MQNIRILSPDSFKTMPWRNGKGNTIELRKEDMPDGNGFSWRLSMADVSTDGEFSNFSGYDRTLLLLEGKGITLNCNKGQQHKLTHRLQSAEFSGDDKTIATLHDGPIKDFNLMTRRNYCSAKVTGCENTMDMQIDIDAEILLIYVVEGELQISSASIDNLAVPQQYLLLIKSPARESLHCRGAVFITTQINYLI